MKRVAQLLVLIAASAGSAYAGQVAPPVLTTPEPMSLALVATGLAAVGGGAWYRRRKR